MIWPLPHLIEAVRVARADRLFPAPTPTAALVARMASSPDPSIHDLPAAVHDNIAHAALEAAIECIGQGEEGGNNRGPFVAMCVEPAKCPANWCAGFVGFMYQRAAARLGIALPFKRSLGAKRLGKNVGAVGKVFKDPREARPGDLMVSHRGPQGSWLGHVAIVERACGHDEHGGYPWVDVIEGNAGPKVRRTTCFPTRPGSRFAFFASVRRG